MAINKKQTPTWMKAVIIAVALSFAALLVLPSLDVFSNRQGDKNAQGQSQLESLAVTYRGGIDANEKSLAADPANYAVLLDQANLYFDWANATRNASQGTGVDLGYWAASASYYERAIEATKDIDPNVGTDFAVACFYASRFQSAVDAIEGVMKKDPDFAPAVVNAGIFYRQSGQNVKALALFQRYVGMSGVDQSRVETVKQWIAELASEPGDEAAPAPAGAGQ